MSAKQPDWAERKARRWFRKWDKYARIEFEAWVIKAFKAERRRAVRVCRELEHKSINGYALGCHDCATAIRGRDHE